jgi:hypothetical protein
MISLRNLPRPVKTPSSEDAVEVGSLHSRITQGGVVRNRWVHSSILLYRVCRSESRAPPLMEDEAVIRKRLGTPEHPGPVPDAGFFTWMYRTDHVRPRRDPRRVCDLRRCVAVGEQVSFIGYGWVASRACASRKSKRRRRNFSGLSMCGECPQSGITSSRYLPPAAEYSSRTARVCETIGWGG